MTVADEIAAAARAGRDSWRTAPPGVDVPCPYDGRGTPRERVLAHAWRQGRLSGIDPAFRGAATR